jgi:hypothetical protein
MNSTTYYPFTEEFKDKLMPLRFGRGAEGVEGKLAASCKVRADIRYHGSFGWSGF